MTDAERAAAYRQRRKEQRSELVTMRRGWEYASESMLIDWIRDAARLTGPKRAKLIMLYAQELANRVP
ncbi:hypothetical protein [Xanthomonas arboricola]|uniref:hypothetical protein n=1 Tax=Xanthomonas arboricola TaxID=56448 RepID=UPI000F8DBD61|nr:hypothetical protein [Xanthomonas arboricola]